MSTNGLEVFDKTLQTTHIWLNEITAEIGPDRQVAWKVLSTVLHKLRDRLPVEVAAHLSAELPLLIRGVRLEVRRGLRTGEVVALQVRAARLLERLERLGVLHALDDDGPAQVVPEQEDRRDDGGGVPVAGEVAGEGLVDLDLVEVELAQVAQRRDHPVFFLAVLLVFQRSKKSIAHGHIGRKRRHHKL